jgi:two-component system, chemotaxis family, chemotaxis protein CheY
MTDEHPLNTFNILIVDDSAMMRAVIKRVIGLCDVPVGTIFEAANGAEALDVLEAQPVQVMMTDLNMPVMTGGDLLREVGRRGSWPALCCVVVSSDGSATRRQDLSEFNVRHYLDKPLSPEVLRDVLTELTDAR